MKKYLLFLILFFLVTLTSLGQNNWDGENSVGNLSYNNNWYGDNYPSTWNSGTDLIFNFNNGNQSSMYNDVGGWRAIRALIYATTFPSALNLDGNGNGFDFYFKVENLSNHNQSVNVPLSAKGSGFELNAVNANLTISGIIYNENNISGNIYNSNSKRTVLSNYIVGNSSVKLYLKNANYGILQINCDMQNLSSTSFQGGIVVERGELWFNSGSKINGGTLQIGNGDGNICKLYINANGGTTISNAVNVPINSTGVYIGGLGTSGINVYSGAFAINSTLNIENTSGGTLDFQGNMTGTQPVNVSNSSGSGIATIKFSTNTKSYSGLTTINNGAVLDLAVSNAIPNTNSVTVNSGGTLKISTNQQLASLVINAGGSVIIDPGVTLTAGSITGSGTITGSPTSNLVLTGTGSTLNFNQTTASTRSLKNLTLNANATATLGTPLEIATGASNTSGIVTVSSGATLTTGGNLTIKSDGNGTASIGNSAGTISGDVTVERWIPQRNASASGGRAYRLLTPTVSGSSINASWQEGLMNTVVGTNIIPGSPFAQYGVQITGSGGNTNGFDVTQNNQASLYTTTNGAGPDLPYTAAPNTSDLLEAKKGYFLYIRGDRSSSMQLPYNPAGGMPTTSTTLRAKGTVQQGNVIFTISTTANDFSMVTNPYASVIDWQKVFDGNNVNIANSYTMWDPNSGTEGGFITVDYAGLPVPASAAGRYIQPGEAFLVKTAGGGGSITITEAMKATGNNNNGIFRMTTPFESFSAELFLTEATNNVRHSADGILVKYDNNYNTGIDGDDAPELNNWNENIAINRSGKQLAVEARPVIVAKDTIPLIIGGLRQTNYEWVFTPSMFTNIGLKAELIDNFLNTRTLLSVIDSVVVPFNVTANPASSAADRFMVVFGTFGPLAIDVISIIAQAKNNSVQVDWTAKTEQDMDRYELERSFNGTSFSNIKTTAAVGNSQVAVNYSWLDVNPQVGNNYYRIKAIDKAGLVKYTSIVKVGFGKTNPAITVSPNPVTGNILNLKLSDLPKGSYTVQLFNSMGQQVLVSRFSHSGGSVNQPVNLTSGIASGTYRLVLSDGETRLRTTIIKN